MTVAVSPSDGDMRSRLAALEQEVESLKEQLEYANSVAGIKRSLAAADRGEGMPLHQFDKEFREKHDIPRA